MAFTSPAEDYREQGLDYNRLIVNNPPATFAWRMRGAAMEGAGIFDGDIVVVDRSLQPTAGRIVVAAWQGEFLIRRLIKRKNDCFLRAANRNYPEIEIKSDHELSLFGVATWTLGHLSNR